MNINIKTKKIKDKLVGKAVMKKDGVEYVVERTIAGITTDNLELAKIRMIHDLSDIVMNSLENDLIAKGQEAQLPVRPPIKVHQSHGTTYRVLPFKCAPEDFQELRSPTIPLLSNESYWCSYDYSPRMLINKFDSSYLYQG